MNEGGKEITIPQVDKDKVIKLWEVCSRGNIIMRVTPGGRIINGEKLIVTGAEVSGVAGDPDSIKCVFVRELDENGQISADDVQFQYDPDLTVVKVGKIDYGTEEYKEMFKVLDDGRRF